jgi:hypothetical protein
MMIKSLQVGHSPNEYKSMFVGDEMRSMEGNNRYCRIVMRNEKTKMIRERIVLIIQSLFQLIDVRRSVDTYGASLTMELWSDDISD